MEVFKLTFRRKSRVDKNQPELVKYFRGNGFDVKHIHQVKHCADIMIAFNGVTALVEIKQTKKCKLTPGEEKFKKEWSGQYYICTSTEDADIIMREERIRSVILKGYNNEGI